MGTSDEHFDGAKVALFLGDRLVSILRDDDPAIPFPNLWDLPGGGRENEETAFETVARETKEEIGLVLRPDMILWQSRFPGLFLPDTSVMFFVARMPEDAVADVILGDEGQCWALYTETEFCALANRVPSYCDRLAAWHHDTSG